MNIYAYEHSRIMPDKTLTISEEAYTALASLKSKDESFTKVILRLAEMRTKGSLQGEDKPLKPAAPIKAGNVVGKQTYREIMHDLDRLRKKWR